MIEQDKSPAPGNELERSLKTWTNHDDGSPERLLDVQGVAVRERKVLSFKASGIPHCGEGNIGKRSRLPISRLPPFGEDITQRC